MARQKKPLDGRAQTAADRREIFIAAYLKDRNVTRAAKAAGYSEKSAHVQGHRLLKDDRVRSRIEKAQQRQVARLELSRENVLDELRAIAFSHPLHFGHVTSDGGFRLDLSQTTDDQFRSFPEIRTKTRRYGKGDDGYVEEETSIKVRGKREALVDLGRHLGLFQDDAAKQMPVTFIIGGLASPGAPQEVLVARSSQVPDQRPRRPADGSQGPRFADPARDP